MDPKLIEQLLAQNAQLIQMLGNVVAGKAAESPKYYPGLTPVPVRAPRAKHTGSLDMIEMPPVDLSTAAGVTEYRPLYDVEGTFGGFFQDGSLDRALLNLLVYPINGLAAMLPLNANNITNDQHGFLVRATVAPDSNFEESTDPCGPAIPLTSDYDVMRWAIPCVKLAHSIKTLDVKNLILRAQQRQYDDFYIVGQWRGVTDKLGPSMFNDAAGNFNVDLVRAAAIRRKMADLGNYFQTWLLHKVWTGDPANTPAGTQIIEPYGIYKFVNGDYSTAVLPTITTTHRVGGPMAEADMKKALSSLVWDAQDKVVGDGTWSLWRQLLDMEEILYQRAAGTGMLPVNWKIFMVTPLWSEIVKHIACEMAADGCTIPNGAGIDKVLNLNDGGMTLFNIQAREQLLNSKALTLNGRTYEVILDDTMPYELVKDDQEAFLGYKGDIFFLPFQVGGGNQVLFWEYLDYSQIGSELSLLPDMTGGMGWSDGGRYYHTITTLRNCIEIQTEFQMRLIFRTPHLAARLDNIVVHRQYQLPMYFNGSGGADTWLVPPTA